MKITQNERGRSMVEMLGVLAVIGVLSIGGIQGYTFAMNKYRANNILNELNMFSNELATALLRANTTHSNTLDLGNPYNEERLLIAEYRFLYGCSHLVGASRTCPANEKGYWMALTGVPKNMCQNLFLSSVDLAYLTKQYVNKNEVTNDFECLDENNFLAFLFDTEGYFLSSAKMPSKYNCPVNTDEDGQGGLAQILTDEMTGKTLYCYCRDVNTKYTSSGQCVPDTMYTCKTNYDCNKGQYCQITSWGSLWGKREDSRTDKFDFVPILTLCGQRKPIGEIFVSDSNN